MSKKIKLISLCLLILILSGCSNNKIAPYYSDKSQIIVKQDQPVIIAKEDWPGNPKILLNYREKKESNYEVKYGDSLYFIARKHNTSIKSIKELNHLSKDTIYAGQNLSLPGYNTLYSFYPNGEWIPIELKKGATIELTSESNIEYYLVIKDIGQEKDYLTLSYLIYSISADR